jgi:CRP-like cAMP-binding protein
MKVISMEKETAFNVLKNTKAFHYLSDDDLDHLYPYCKFVSFEKKEKIITTDEISPNLYIIAKGSVNVMVHKETDEEVYLSSIGAGDIFGEAALFINMKRTADVNAVEYTELIQIERRGLFNYFKLYPQAGIKILMVITYSLLLKLKGTQQHLDFFRKLYVDQDEVDKLMNEIIEM